MSTKLPFQYGESPEHIVYLTENQASAVNNLRFYPLETVDKAETNSIFGYAYLPDGLTMEDYNSASEILNEYLSVVGGIPCSEEYLEHNEILTPIEL